MKKRIIGLFISGILAISCCLPVHAEVTENAILPTTKEAASIQSVLPYRDVSPNSWYYDYVYDVYEKGLMTGMNETTFAPDVTLSRAHFATILWRMVGSPEVPYTEKFPDVPEGQFYTTAVMWASENGIITGYTDSGLFKPADQITREQIAAMLYRYASFIGENVSNTASLTSFSDNSKVSEFAKVPMEWCVAEGIISGDGVTGELLPQGNTSRAVCATIISRFTSAETPECEHIWAEKTVTVEHPAETHEELISEAWDEVILHEEEGHYEVNSMWYREQIFHPETGHVEYVEEWVEENEIKEQVYINVCNFCNEDITGNTTAHIKNHMLNGETGSWRGEWVYKVVGTETIVHEAEYKWVVDEKSYLEEVIREVNGVLTDANGFDTEVPVLTKKECIICSDCGMDITELVNDGKYSEHTAVCTCDEENRTGSYHSETRWVQSDTRNVHFDPEWIVDVEAYVEIIHHDEVYQTVTDREAWTETLTYKICSNCGKRR